MRSPVSQADWSEARKSATLAMSSGWPMRPIGSGEADRLRDLGAQARGGEAFGLGHARRDGVDPDSLGRQARVASSRVIVSIALFEAE